MPDNTKAIVQTADALEPLFTAAFLEYAQARGFHIDPARVRTPTDKGRVERSVRDVRDDCFGGERMFDIEQTRSHARRWCEHEYGMRRHSTTYRLPREHFDAVERPALLAAPTTAFDVPLWADPKVARDHFAQVARALYSLPTRLIGKTLRARADSQLVRFYDGGVIVKTHPRQPPGGRSIDPTDFPKERRPYAMRDVTFLHAQARELGESVGMFAAKLLEAPLPWTKMRGVRALIGLARRFGADSGHRDHRDRFIVITRIGIVIAESERSDVFGWFGRRGWCSSRSEATFSVGRQPDGFLRVGPFNLIRCAVCTTRSRSASAIVGSPT
jgi:hypothetical protein